MLTKLLPDQISKFWDILKYAIQESLPPTVNEHPDKLNRILTSALSSSIDIWVSYNKLNNVIKFEAVVLTKITYDDTSCTKGLLIYCLYGYDSVDKQSWSEGLKTIVKFAYKEKCSRILAYTNSKYIIQLVNKLGGNTDYTLCSFNVNEMYKEIKNEDNN